MVVNQATVHRIYYYTIKYQGIAFFAIMAYFQH